MDNDGKLDLIVTPGPAGSGSGVVAIYRNTTTGPGSMSFSVLNVPLAGYSAGQVAVTDFDGDGKPDLAVSSNNFNAFTILRNTTTSGTISFSAAQLFNVGPLGVRAFNLNSGDFDGDGKSDLAVVLSNNTLSIFRNISSSGAINFGSRIDYLNSSSGNDTQFLPIGDLDGDGKLDIVSGTALLRNTSSALGSISFAAKVDLTVGFHEIVDVNGDGKADLVGISNAVVSVLRNLSRTPPSINSFSPKSGPVGTSVTISGTDFSTIPSNNIVFFGGSRASVVSSTTNSIVVTVPVGSTYQPISVLTNGLLAFSKNPFILTFSGDGPIGSGSFATKITLDAGSYPNELAVADLDLDGKLDIGNSNNFLNATSGTVSRNTSSSVGLVSFASKLRLINAGIATPQNNQSFNYGDFDGDGKIDVVVSGPGPPSNNISVFLNTSPNSGTVSFSNPVGFTLSGGNNYFDCVASLADIDNDGRVDVVVGNNTYPLKRLSIFRNISSGSGSINFATEISIDLSNYIQGLVLADLDGDNLVDVGALTDVGLSIFRNTTSNPGLITLAPKLDFASSGNTIRSGDFDGDGKIDLFTDGGSIFRNSSTGVGFINFSTSTLSNTLTRYPLIADLDGDGKLDIADNGSILRNISSGPGVISFSSKVDFRPANNNYWGGIAIGDIDGDGKPDVMAADWSDNTISVYRRQITPPAPVASAATSVTKTSFVANWASSPGATTSYFLDVSTSNSFATFVTGYNNLPLSNATTSYSVSANLQPGTTYYYRVRASDVVPVSVNSNIISVITIPADPVSNAATAIGQTSFSANWSASQGTSNYVLDVATDAAFGSPIAGSPFSIGNLLTRSVTGLAAGTTHYYRVRAVNAGGASGNSATQSATTIPPDPVAATPSNMTQTSLSANWAPCLGATSYFLDASTSNTFSTFISGYNNLSVGNVLTYPLVGLSPGTTYFYRIRSSNASGVSANSNIISITTVPPNPVLTATTNITPTSVTLNWNPVASATSFLLDVSTDNFLNFVIGYNGLTISGTNSFAITGLSPGTNYQIRLRSQNSSGISSVSNVLPAITFAGDPISQPTALVFPDRTPFSISASFTNATGSPSGYIVLYRSGSSPVDVPIDGQAYAVGNTIGTSTVAYVGSANNFILSGLSPNTVYYFDVFSYNGTVNTYNYLTSAPLEGNIATLATEPTTQATNFGFSNVTANSATISYNLAIGNPSGYVVLRRPNSAVTEVPVDGTEYKLNDQVGASTMVQVGLNSSFTDSGLLSGTNYYYAVFSFNGAINTYNYLTTAPLSGNLLTKPAAPLALDATNILAGAFKARWNAVAGATSYELDVSLSSDFSSFLAGYNSKALTAAEENLSNLSMSQTNYWYRLRAVNASGKSVNSNVISVTTPAQVISNPLTFLTPNITGFKVSVTLTGGTGTRIVKFYQRGITASSFGQKTFISLTDSYETTLSATDLDELGAEFYFSASDASTATPIETEKNYLYGTFTASSSTGIPFNSNFNGSQSTYEMFSIPYNLNDKSIASIFDEQGAPDKTKWRLLRYQGGKYIEYPDNITNIELGKGYWFNTKTKTEIRTGDGEVSKSNQKSSFTLTLEQGWNQIGNPYPFNLDWNAIKNVNQAAGLNSLWLFENGNYVKKDVLARWKGAFVFSDNGGSITFPVLAKTSAAGRIAIDILSPTIDDEAWQVPITLSLNGLIQSSAVGMHPEAKASKDKFDEITLPRFLEYLEMGTYHQDFFAHHFSTDVVPTANQNVWSFTSSSSQASGMAVISWDQRAIQNSHAKLALLDVQGEALVDMKLSNQYQFAWSEGRQFKILYSKKDEILPGVTFLGNAYPNPFNASVAFPIVLGQDQEAIQINIYDLMGRKVKSISKQQVKAGAVELHWDGLGDQGNSLENGLYLYQLKGDKGIMSSAKKMIKF